MRVILKLSAALMLYSSLALAQPPPTITEYPIPTANAFPSDITAGPDGALWFTEGAKVARITTAGAISEYPIPTANTTPTGITVGPDGALWFGEGVNKIDQIMTDGSITQQSTAAYPAFGVVDMTLGPDGALWFTSYDIQRFTTAGNLTTYKVVPFGDQLQSITVGPDGALWFTLTYAAISNNPQSDNIGRITATGAFTQYPLPTLSSNPFAITAGPDGALWFTEFKGNKTGPTPTAGTLTEYPIPTPSAGPRGIAVGPDGALWF